ncbi:MAG TPA: tetratricopeptide repeat protein [Candidatus Acidoferrum sp.]|nr:tetratricopeptide repeat protein [Candidatus Acidoferrum sp.]
MAFLNEQAEAASVSWRSEKLTWCLASALVCVTFAVYFPALRNGFVDLDDPAYVTDNAHVRSGLSWGNIRWAFGSFEAANWHPLTWLSHMADCQIFGLNAAGHHFTNILLHAINAVLLFWLLYRATNFCWRSFAVAALFAVHPLNVQTVAWVAERKSLLCMLFSLVTVACYGWYAREPAVRKYLAVAGCFALALLAKPMAVTLPVILLLVDYWPLQRLPVPASTDGERFGKRLGLLLLEKAPLLAMSAVSSWITVAAQREGHALSTMATVPMGQRLENAVWSYVRYLGKMVWPSRLAYIYEHPGNRLTVWQISAAALLLIAVTLLVCRFRERRHLVFGWGLFLVALVPVIGIVQVGLQAMADRYAYLPLIGLFVMLVWETSAIASRWDLPEMIRKGAAAFALAALGATAFVNAGYWRNNLTLFGHAHEVTSPPYFQIEINLGAALTDHGRTGEALQAFRTAEKLGPDLFVPHFNIGYLLAQAGDYQGALPELQEAVRCAINAKEKARAVNNLAAADLELGNNEAAADAFSELITLQPASVAGWAGRGQARLNLARYGEANEDFSQALKMQRAPELLLMSGKALEGGGKFPEAADVYREALRADPALEEARKRLELMEAQRNSSASRAEKK